MRGVFNDIYIIFCLDFLYKSLCSWYSFELPPLVEEVQMSINNVCFYKEVDISTQL